MCEFCDQYERVSEELQSAQHVSALVTAAGLLVFPSFKLFSLTAFVHIHHVRIRAMGVSSTLFPVKTVEDVPDPLTRTFNRN